METVVDRLDPKEWKVMAEKAHLICFEENRPGDMNRIDFTLLNVRDGQPLDYCTVRELDKESVYWQHGGAFPNTKGTGTPYYSYKRYAKWCFENEYKRVSTYIENNNSPMLKIAAKVGFRIIGMRTFKGSILLEHYLEPEWML